MKHAAILLLLMFAWAALERHQTTMIAHGTFHVMPQPSDAPSRSTGSF